MSPRSLQIFGPEAGGAIFLGAVSVTGDTVLVTMADFSIENGCGGAGLSVSESAEVRADGLGVQSSNEFGCPPPDLIFADGFE